MHPRKCIINSGILLVFRYNSEDLWWSIAYFRKGVKIYQSTCREMYPPPPPHTHTDGKVGIRVAEKFRFFRFTFNKFQPKVCSVSSSPPGSAAHLWWAMMIGWVIWVMKVNWNVKEAPLTHQKMKNSFLYYVQLLMIGQVIQVTKVYWNVEKGLLSHQKIKCSFLDYMQLLMISQAIWAMKVDQNMTKGPQSHQ